MEKDNIKTCTKCNIKKPLDEFFKDKGQTSGYRPDCKICTQKYYVKNKEKIKQVQRKYYKENKEKLLKQTKEFRKQFPWKKLLYSIKQRCTNKNCKDYKNYGGRGIKCLINEEQLKALWFRDKAYELKQASIDRKENDGHYEYDNCQFIEMEINRIKDRYKGIYQFNLENKFIKEWRSQKEAGEFLGIFGKNINACCLGKRKTAGGFKWRFKNG